MSPIANFILNPGQAAQVADENDAESGSLARAKSNALAQHDRLRRKRAEKKADGTVMPQSMKP